MEKRMKYSLLVFVVGLMLVGCSSTPMLDVSTIEGSVDAANIIYNSGVVKNRLEIIEVNTDSTANGLFQVQAVVKSKYKEPQSIQYKYEWLSDQGIQVDESPWKPVVIYGSATANLGGVSSSSAAKNFRLLIAEN
jgi:uncharacterized protein YcfL